MDQDRLTSVDDIIDELQDWLKPCGPLASIPAQHLSPPEGDIKDVIVKTVLMETFNVGGAIYHCCYASVL